MQEDDFKLKLKAHGVNCSRRVDGVCAAEKSIDELMDNELPAKSLQQDCSGRQSMKVKELTAHIQQLRQSVQEKELTIRKNEISSNFKVRIIHRLHAAFYWFELNSVQIESANNKIECLQKQNECVKRQNDTLMLNIRDLQNHVKHFEETCFCRYRVNEVIAIRPLGHIRNYNIQYSFDFLFDSRCDR